MSLFMNIQVSEHLDYPDYSIVAMYKHLVIGCALMTPDGYLNYIAVLPGWERAGVARYMLYYLIKVHYLPVAFI